MFSKKIVLDCAKFGSRMAAHKQMQEAFKEYEYYGTNLDALHDCLTSVMRKTKVKIINAEKGREYLGEYMDKIITVFNDSADENKNLRIKL